LFFKRIILVFIIGFSAANLLAQKNATEVKADSVKKIKEIKIKAKLKTNKGGVYNPLSPSKAAFYSAIFPGMGQIYNKKYWKAPVVWGILAVPAYYYQINNTDYKRYRTAYRLRKSGLQDEFTLDDGTIIASTETLETAQKQLRENRDMSLLTGVILYILQIVEASVNAHLLQFNTDDDLSFKPSLIMDPIRIETPSVGLTIKYTF
jgi:hypothetical protein